jgi:hypothetical protein
MVLEGAVSYAVWVWDYIIALDIDYIYWLLWLIRPVILIFVLPLTVLLMLYLCAIFLWVFQYRRNLQEAYHHALWDGARHTICAFWDAFGHYYHGMSALFR